MKIELTSEQFEQLKDILGEYRETSWSSIFQYKRYAVDADDETVRRQYSAFAEEEEEKYKISRALQEYFDSIKVYEA